MEGVAALPPLRETIARHGLDARKRLGQHFLLDLNLTRRIARAATPLDQGTTIEVGPGPGAGHPGRCADRRSGRAWPGAAPHRRQPALQHLDAPAGTLAAGGGYD